MGGSGPLMEFSINFFFFFETMPNYIDKVLDSRVDSEGAGACFDEVFPTSSGGRDTTSLGDQKIST